MWCAGPAASKPRPSTCSFHSRPSLPSSDSTRIDTASPPSPLQFMLPSLAPHSQQCICTFIVNNVSVPSYSSSSIDPPSVFLTRSICPLLPNVITVPDSSEQTAVSRLGGYRVRGCGGYRVRGCEKKTRTRFLGVEGRVVSSDRRGRLQREVVGRRPCSHPNLHPDCHAGVECWTVASRGSSGSCGTARRPCGTT